jgi:CMP-N-acetylneuraminic acid synthetase
MKIAAFIPARKNSKRIKHKNRLKINNQLCLQKVVNNIQRSRIADTIFISTDDEYFFSKIDGVKFLERDSNFSDDFSTVIDLLSWHQHEHLMEYDFILHLYPHSICIDPDTIINAVNQFKKSKSLRMLSVAKLPSPIEWTFKLDNNMLISNYPGAELIRSQDLEENYYNTGQFYIYKKEWFSKKDLENKTGYIIDRFQGVDVDEEPDIDLLKQCYEYYSKKIKALC